MKNDKKIESGEKMSRKLALHYMATLAEVARESFLILDPNLRVIMANPTFYQSFKVLSGQTENELLYRLGNGQWDIPELKKLLGEILPKKKVIKNYEVKHRFETIGERTMLLNSRQIDSIQLIILAIEDITPRKKLEEELDAHLKNLETKVAERTIDLSKRVKELEILNKTMVGRELKMMELKEEIEVLKKKIKNGNGNHKKRTP
jgi:hypothetical protein